MTITNSIEIPNLNNIVLKKREMLNYICIFIKKVPFFEKKDS